MLAACGFSWALWLTAILAARGLLPFRFHPGPLGSFGPSLAAVLVTYVTGGGSGVRELLRRLLRWRVRPAWYAFALLGTVAMFIAATGAFVLLTGSRLAPEGLGRWYLIPPLFLVVLVLGGPLGEELGWRGFLLPRLQQQWDGLRSSLALAGLWWLWHVPAFWLEGAAQEGTSLAGFAVAVVAEAVLFTWLYNRSGGSLLLVLLFHAAVNTTSFCLGVVLPQVADDPLFGGLFLLVLGATAAGVTLVEGRELGRAHAAGPPG